MKPIRALYLLALLLALLPAAQATTQPKEDDRPIEADAPKPATAPSLNPALPTLFLVGDSTMHSTGQPRGWAQEVAPYFDLSKINVVDRAIGGRSSKTFLTEGRWDKVLADLKKGDFVIVQFGHNDNGRYDDPAAKARPSLRSEGEETADWTRPDGKAETVHTFGWYMRNYATTAKAKGATVILASMVPHKDWADGKIRRNERESFVKWTQNAAKATDSLFLDMNDEVAWTYEAMGPEKVNTLFADARTHTNADGAKVVAATFIKAIPKLPGNPLEPFLNEKGKSLQASAAK